MSKKLIRYTKDFENAALREFDSSQSFVEVSRKTGVSVATLRRWNRDPRNFRLKLVHSEFPAPGKYVRMYTMVPHRATAKHPQIRDHQRDRWFSSKIADCFVGAFRSSQKPITKY